MVNTISWLCFSGFIVIFWEHCKSPFPSANIFNRELYWRVRKQITDVMGKQRWDAIPVVNCLICIACLASQKFVFILSFSSVLLPVYPFLLVAWMGVFSSMAGLNSMSDIVNFLSLSFPKLVVPHTGFSWEEGSEEKGIFFQFIQKRLSKTCFGASWK